jgi:hypothetical protein
MRRVMEERMLASIQKMPEKERATALAEHEERKKFFEEISQLPPEERRAKFQERMEERMNNPENAQRFESNMAKRGAMQTAEQRAERYRGYMDRKQRATQ